MSLTGGGGSRRALPAPCEAVSILTDRECGTPTYTRYRVACVHEHVSEHWLCPSHATMVAGFCARCLADGHRCLGFAVDVH